MSIFDPEGSGYDDAVGKELSELHPLTIPKPTEFGKTYITEKGAFQAWVWHNDTGDYKKHSGSFDPRTGMMLKGRQHPTINLTLQEEDRLGNEIYKAEDGRYYTRKSRSSMPAVEALAEQNRLDDSVAITTVVKNIKLAMRGGMTASEVVEAFDFPEDANNPAFLIASLAVAAEFDAPLEDAAMLYSYYKATYHPKKSDEDVMELLLKTEGLPKEALTEEYYKEKAAEEKIEAKEEYSPERKKLEDDFDDMEQGLFKNSQEFLRTSIPVINERVRKILDDDWFGKGNQTNEARERFFDSMHTAETAEEEDIAEAKYTRNLKIQQQYRINEYNRYEYQLRYKTSDETQLKRWQLSARQANLMARGTLSNVNKKLNQFWGAFAPTTKSKEFYHSRAQWYEQDRRNAFAMANAPELWREELNWFDGGTSAVLKNTPTAILSMSAAGVGYLLGGPAGAKWGVGLMMGAAESGGVWEACVERGFTHEEANIRANLAWLIDGAIESAGGGITKWAPRLKKKAFGILIKTTGHLGINFLKEFLEEMGQEFTNTVLADNAPYKEDGSFDYAEAANQFLLLARDTMFMATAFASGQAGLSKGWKRMTRNKVLAQNDYNDVARIQQYLAENKDANDTGEDALNPKSREITEDLSEVIDGAGQFYLKDMGRGKYQIYDADSGMQYSKEGTPRTDKKSRVNYEYEEAKEIADNANAYGKETRPTNDPIVKLNRYIESRINNGVQNPIFDNIAKMLNPASKHQDRIVSAHELAKYITTLRDKIAKYMGPERAGVHIPQETIDNLHLIPDMWKDAREIKQHLGKPLVKPRLGFITEQSKLDVANELRGVIRMHQKYGDTAEGQMRRNWINSMIEDIVPNKHQKPILSEEDAKTNIFVRFWDMGLGTSKDDQLTTLVKFFGNKGTRVAMKNINAREASNNIFENLTLRMMNIQADLEISKDDLHDWSTPLKRAFGKPTEIDVMLGGEKHQLTMGQIIYANLALQDVANKDTMTTVGVAFPNLDIPPLNNGEVAELERLLRTNDKAFKYYEELLTFYRYEMGEIKNKASNEMLGYNIVTENKFLPPVRKGDKGQGSLMLMDVFTQTTEDIRLTSHYVGIKPTADMMLDLVNDVEFIRHAQRDGKNRQLKRFKQEMQAMEKTRHPTGEDLTKLITRIGAKRARAILANGRIAVLQAGSFQLYMNETDWRYMFGGKMPDDILKQWDMLRQRKEGMGGVSSVVSVNTVRKMHLGKGSVLDYALYPLHKVDLIVIRQAARIAWNEMNAKQLTGKARRWWKTMDINPQALEIGSPEFMDALHSRASYLASTTQPMFFPESRNLYSNSNSALMRELSRFRSFTDQLLRNNARKIALWKMGEISTREMSLNVGLNLAFATVWYNGLKWVIYEIFRDEDEKERDLLLEIMLGPLTLIPFIGYSIQTGVRSLAESSGYGPASLSTISADQIKHTMDTAYKFSKAILADMSDKPGSARKAEKLYKEAMRDSLEDFLVLGCGLPTWLANVVPEEEDEKKVSVGRSSQYRTR